VNIKISAALDDPSIYGSNDAEKPCVGQALPWFGAMISAWGTPPKLIKRIVHMTLNFSLGCEKKNYAYI
jgi:hypothetical protein